jgi:hypothetical protein
MSEHAARRHADLTLQDIVADAKRVAAMLRHDYLSVEEYDKYGQYASATAIRKAPGRTWLAFLDVAGLKPGPGYRRPLEIEQLSNEFLAAVEQGGRVPSFKRLASLAGRGDATFGRKFHGYPQFKLQAIDHIFASGRPLSVGVRKLLESERRRCAAKVKSTASPDRTFRSKETPDDAPRGEGVDSLLASLIDKLKRDDEDVTIEAKEAFFTNTKDDRASPGKPQANPDSALEDMLRTVVAFANTIGGDFVIGLKNKTWEAVGIDQTDLLLCKNWDEFKRRFTRLVSDKVGGVVPAPEILKKTSSGRTVAIIRVSQLPQSCFVNRDLAHLKSNSLPYVRTNGDSVELKPHDRAKHCDAMLARKGS